LDERCYGGESVGVSLRVKDIGDGTVGVVGLMNPGETRDKLDERGPDRRRGVDGGVNVTQVLDVGVAK